MKDRLIKGGAFLLFATLLTGCQPEGPAEKAGKTVDNAARDVKDAVTPPGPLEKAGESIDKAVKP